MEKESHEDNNHTISGDFMGKRKRGRPRKHLKLDSTEQSLGPPTGYKRSQQQPQQRDDNEAMVGKPVSGMIEATFEAGFLLSVKIGNSDGILRGVVFKPGCCDPISFDNDIAPDVRMIRRNIGAKHCSNVKSRALVPVPMQPGYPTIPKNLLVPVMLQPVNRQNGRRRVPVHDGPMQSETESQVNGASNGKQFETLLTQVMKTGEVHHATPVIEAESDEQALSIEPLQAIHPIHPVHPVQMPKPISDYGRGKMTELLQAVQENVRETHISEGQ